MFELELRHLVVVGVVTAVDRGRIGSVGRGPGVDVGISTRFGLLLEEDAGASLISELVVHGVADLLSPRLSSIVGHVNHIDHFLDVHLGRDVVSSPRSAPGELHVMLTIGESGPAHLVSILRDNLRCAFEYMVNGRQSVAFEGCSGEVFVKESLSTDKIEQVSLVPFDQFGEGTASEESGHGKVGETYKTGGFVPSEIPAGVREALTCSKGPRPSISLEFDWPRDSLLELGY